jgi:hypothetical protein
VPFTHGSEPLLHVRRFRVPCIAKVQFFIFKKTRLSSSTPALEVVVYAAFSLVALFMMASSLTPEELAAYLAGPGLTPPNGTTSNFHNPPNQNGLAVAFITVCVTFATAFLFARAYLKVVCLRRVEIEDCMPSSLGAELFPKTH